MRARAASQHRRSHLTLPLRRYFRYSNLNSIVKLPYPALSLDPLAKWVPGWVSALKKYVGLGCELGYFLVYVQSESC